MNSGRVDDDAFQRIFVHETTLARDTVTMRGLLLALLLGAGSAYTRTSFMGARSALSSGRAAAGRSNLRMEDFGLLKNSGIGFDDLWEGQPVISEAKLEQVLNEGGIRFKMNKTAKEAEGLRTSPTLFATTQPCLSSRVATSNGGDPYGLT